MPQRLENQPSPGLTGSDHTGPAPKESTRSTAGKTQKIRSGELWRKGFHLLPGFLPFLLGAIPHPRPLDMEAYLIVFAFCVLLTAMFLSYWRVMQRPGERNLLSSTLAYPGVVLATMAAFPANVEFTGVVVEVLAFGDAAALIGGTLFGRTKLPWNDRKTWVGSIGFVIAAAPAATLAYHFLAVPSTNWGPAVACGCAAALCGAGAESLPVRITDNLRIGLAAAVAVATMHSVTTLLF